MPRPIKAVNISVTSGEMAVRTALEKLQTALKPLDLAPEESGAVELVMAEALNNIVEHAYPEGSPAGPIRIRATHKSDGLHLTVVDEGLGMPDGKLPLGAPAQVDVDLFDLPEGGFGWFLIKDLAKDVEYKRLGWENHLKLRIIVGIKDETV
ncbi:MAG: ATP-binding protein [Paracoccaceae bacterium]